MGEMIQLRAIDGFAFGAYACRPEGSPRGAVVVIQEIFGVNSHIRNVVRGYAQAGYYAIAPALFDRAERDVELGYEPHDMTRGVGLARGKSKREHLLADLQATVDHAATFGKVGVVGYCFGGMLTWVAAAQVKGVAAASSYYGGGVAAEVALQPKCPVIMHFGERDAHIPMTQVEEVRAAHPGVPVYVYAADHGFNCDHRGSYDAAAASLALERTLALFAAHVASGPAGA